MLRGIHDTAALARPCS